MLVEKRTLGGQRRRFRIEAEDLAVHHLAQERDVILRLGNAVGARDTGRRQVPAQVGERLFIEKTGPIVGRVRLELPAGHADEQGLVFLGYASGRAGGRRGRERAEGRTDGSAVGADAGQARQHGRIRRRRQQVRE